MSLSWPVVAEVLFGAFLHAAWYPLVQSCQDKVLDLSPTYLQASAVTLSLVLLTRLRQTGPST